MLSLLFCHQNKIHDFYHIYLFQLFLLFIKLWLILILKRLNTEGDSIISSRLIQILVWVLPRLNHQTHSLSHWIYHLREYRFSRKNRSHYFNWFQRSLWWLGESSLVIWILPFNRHFETPLLPTRPAIGNLTMLF